MLEPDKKFCCRFKVHGNEWILDSRLEISGSDTDQKSRLLEAQVISSQTVIESLSIRIVGCRARHVTDHRRRTEGPFDCPRSSTDGFCKFALGAQICTATAQSATTSKLNMENKTRMIQHDTYGWHYTVQCFEASRISHSNMQCWNSKGSTSHHHTSQYQIHPLLPSVWLGGLNHKPIILPEFTTRIVQG